MTQRELLLEAAVAVWRERDAEGRILPSADWWDLTPAERDRLFQHQLAARSSEAAMDPLHLSATTHAVLDRIADVRQLPPKEAR